MAANTAAGPKTALFPETSVPVLLRRVRRHVSKDPGEESFILPIQEVGRRKKDKKRKSRFEESGALF